MIKKNSLNELIRKREEKEGKKPDTVMTIWSHLEEELKLTFNQNGSK